jgi:hypothetical protein
MKAIVDQIKGGVRSIAYLADDLWTDNDPKKATLYTHKKWTQKESAPK